MDKERFPYDVANDPLVAFRAVPSRFENIETVIELLEDYGELQSQADIDRSNKFFRKALSNSEMLTRP